VTSPSGEDWELYVSKTALPAWRTGDSDGMETGGGGPWSILELPVAIIVAVWNLIVPLARVLVLLPVAVIRGRRSHAVRVEAMTSFPRQQVLLWTTTDVHVARVLDEIAAGLANGKIVQPDGAVYTGPET
jgi:hypothetical protein